MLCPQLHAFYNISYEVVTGEKHIGKTLVAFWGKSANSKSSLGCYKWYQSIPLLVPCALGMNQTEFDWHVNSKVGEGGERLSMNT